MFNMNKQDNSMTLNQLKKVFKAGKTFYRVCHGQIEVVQLQGRKIDRHGCKYIIGVGGHKEQYQGFGNNEEPKTCNRWVTGKGSYFDSDLQAHNGSDQGFACFDTIRKAQRYLADYPHSHVNDYEDRWDVFSDDGY